MFLSFPNLPEDRLSSFHYGCDQKASVSERCTKTGTHTGMYVLGYGEVFLTRLQKEKKGYTEKIATRFYG